MRDSSRRSRQRPLLLKPLGSQPLAALVLTAAMVLLSAVAAAEQGRQQGPTPRAWGVLPLGGGIELSAATFFCWTSRATDRARLTDAAAGLELGFGLRYRREHSSSRIGLTPVSRSSLFGDHLGLDLRARLGYQHRTIDATASHSLSVDLVPVLRWAHPEGRWRLPTLLALVTPAIGIQHVRQRPLQLRMRIANASLGLLLSDGLALEIEAGMLVRLPLTGKPDESRIGAVGLDAQLRLVVLR